MVHFKAPKQNRKLWQALLLCSTASLPGPNAPSKLTAILLCLSSEIDEQMQSRIQERFCPFATE